jgi:hypothetical protein
MKATLYLRDVKTAYSIWCNTWQQHVKASLFNGQPLEVEIRPARRSTEQNSKLWAMLNEVATQVEWYGQHLSPEEWKHVFTASLKKQRVVPGIDGGFVVLGLSTSRMSKAELSELIELILAFGAERGVDFQDSERHLEAADQNVAEA